MSKEFDDILKKINQSDKLFFRDITNLEKDHEKIIKEISDIKKQVKDMSLKINLILEILNNFTLMLSEDNNEVEDDYDNDETWVPKEKDFWEDDSDDSV
jgi:hypothetical protein